MSRQKHSKPVLSNTLQPPCAPVCGQHPCRRTGSNWHLRLPYFRISRGAEHFIRGVGYLHSFGMTQAQREFRRAQELEPDFAMAYWGEAFTYQHPFFGQKDDGPGNALMRLGATSEERLAHAPTEREKGFLRAAEAYALTVGGMAERRTAWMHAMADLYEKFPDDDEVKAFYAASMLAAATVEGADRDRINMRAGALALRALQEERQPSGRCTLCNPRLRRPHSCTDCTGSCDCLRRYCAGCISRTAHAHSHLHSTRHVAGSLSME